MLFRLSSSWRRGSLEACYIGGFGGLGCGVDDGGRMCSQRILAQSLVVRRALHGHGNVGVTQFGLCEDVVAVHACSCAQVVQRPRFIF